MILSNIPELTRLILRTVANNIVYSNPVQHEKSILQSNQAHRSHAFRAADQFNCAGYQLLC
jgi:hypothetical protein